MEYSADDVAAARILQYVAYIYIALATLWIYDYIWSLHEESTFLRRSRWSKVKALYIITRYAPFCLITTNIHLALAPNANPNTCRTSINIYSCFAVISLTCSECLFVLRTYALWNSNRKLLVAMLSTLFAIIVSFIGIWFAAISTSDFITSAIPGITGCYRTASSIRLTLPFILLFVFQLGLVSLTLIRAIQSWRSTGGPLHAALVKHNILYYVCGLLLSTANVLVPMLFPYSVYHSFLEDLEVFTLAILATRMHLHLWHIGQHVFDSFDSDSLVWISLSGGSPAYCTM